MCEEQLNKMLEEIENAFWYLKNCKCNVDVTTKGHKWETYYGLDDDLIKYIRKIENQLQQKENIIKKLEEFIEREIELYTVELTEENKNKLSIVAPIKGVYKEIYNVLQELKDSDKE